MAKKWRKGHRNGGSRISFRSCSLIYYRRSLIRRRRVLGANCDNSTPVGPKPLPDLPQSAKESTPAFVRITPVYRTKKVGTPEELYTAKVHVKQGGHTAAATFKALQQWSPFATYWVCEGTDFTQFEFGPVEIEGISSLIHFSGYATTKSTGYLIGGFEKPVITGSDHKIDALKFHLADYPDLETDEINYEVVRPNELPVFEDGVCEDEVFDILKVQVGWSEIHLVAVPWSIRVQPYKDTHFLHTRVRQKENRPVLSGVGLISRLDGAQFKKKSTLTLLDALDTFFSFCFGRKSPVCIPVGGNQLYPNSSRFFRNCTPTGDHHLRGWLGLQMGSALEEIFPAFMVKWNDPTWHSPFKLAVEWLVELQANSGSPSAQVAVAQIPLEMLSWMVFSDADDIVPADEFRNLSAATKLNLLFRHFCISTEVPLSLEEVRKVTHPKPKPGARTLPKPMSAPTFMVEYRNRIVHPTKSNRNTASEWREEVDDQLLFEGQTVQLFSWYLTLVLLRLLDYNGCYANRLKSRSRDNPVIEQVPWATSQEESIEHS